MDEYRSAAAAIRENAKWALTTLGAVGALLVTGLGLSSLANLQETAYLIGAILGITTALVGVAWAIVQTAQVLRPSTATFADVVAEEKKGAGQHPSHMQRVFADRTTAVRAVADSFEDLQARYYDALALRVQALLDSYADPSDQPKANAAQAANYRATLYGERIDAIVANVAYHQVAARLETWRQVGAAFLVALGVGVFAVMLALPIDPKPDLHGAVLRDVDLSGVRIVGADLSGMTLDHVDLRDTDLRDANFDRTKMKTVKLEGADVRGASFDGTRWTRSICPDGARTSESDTCKHHLGRRDR